MIEIINIQNITLSHAKRTSRTQHTEKNWLFSNLKTKLFIRFIKIMSGYFTLQCLHFKAFWSFGWSRFVERRDAANRLETSWWGEMFISYNFQIYLNPKTDSLILWLLRLRGDKDIYFVYKQPCSYSVSSWQWQPWLRTDYFITVWVHKPQTFLISVLDFVQWIVEQFMDAVTYNLLNSTISSTFFMAMDCGLVQ